MSDRSGIALTAMADLASSADAGRMRLPLWVDRLDMSLQGLVKDVPYEAVHQPQPDAGHALRRGIASRPVPEPVMRPRHANTGFSLA